MLTNFILRTQWRILFGHLDQNEVFTFYKQNIKTVNVQKTDLPGLCNSTIIAKNSLRIQKSAQMTGTAGMAQLAKRLGLDLTNTLAGDVKLLAHLLQRAGATVVQTKA